MTRSRTSAVAVGAALLLLSGCAGDGDVAATSTSASATSASPEESDNHGEELSPAPLPPTSMPSRTSTSPAGSGSPENLTLAAMTVFVADYQTADAWFDAVAPYLSRQARQDWIGTDPAEIPATMLVGPPIVNAQTDYLTAVDQGTDAGIYQLLLARAPDGTWIVERITPPEQPVVGG